jgi:nitrogen fixation/metabolism regulation signal transduction histidine kinase
VSVPSFRARLVLTAIASTALAAIAFALAGRAVGSTGGRVAVAVAIAAPLSLVLARVALGPLPLLLRALGDGLSRFAEGDFAVRVRPVRGGEIGDIVAHFNRLGEALRGERDDGYQRGLLLETVLEAAPMVVLIATEAGRIVHANAAVRAFFAADERLEGRALDDLLAAAPPELRAAIDAGGDTLIAVERGGEHETLHVARRSFRQSTQLHTLLLLRPLTRELARQEALTYKNAIRLISHEINNSLAPIASLLHSARKMLGRPEHEARLASVLDVIDERSRHLQRFLEGYAALARLPVPSPRAVAWTAFFAPIRELYAFHLGDVPAEPGWFDPVQLQQLVINLLKNAIEAGSPAPAIDVTVTRGPAGDVALRVADRGGGIDDEALQKALLPFYSTKKTGSGVGLALCREIALAHGGALSLRRREGGGVEVECRLPPPAEA